MENKKTEVSNISPEELLSRVKTILESTIKQSINPKQEPFVGVNEIATFCNESPRWVYGKCSSNFLPHYKTGKNASLKFKYSEVAEVIAKHKVECDYKSHFEYTIDENGNIIK